MHSHVTRYLRNFEEGGFAKLLERAKPKPPETPIRQSIIQEEIHDGLLAGQFRSAHKLQEWLLEKHGIKRTYWSAYCWLNEKHIWLSSNHIESRREKHLGC